MSSHDSLATRHHEVRPGQVIEEAFALYGRYARVLLPTALVIIGVFALLQALILTTGSLALAALGSALQIVASTLYAGFVVKLVDDVRDGRRDFAVSDLFASAAGVIGALVINGFLLGIAVAIGLIALIIPGLFLITIWAVTAPVIVVERAGAIDAFGRSRELVNGHKLKVFLTLLLGLLVSIGIGIVFGAIGEAFGDGGQVVLRIIGSVIGAPVLSLIVAILYFELRGEPVRADGPDTGSAEAPPPAAAV